MPRVFNSGNWTQARFNSYIKGVLRHATMRWPPKIEVKKEARVERGVYKCAGYKRRKHNVPVTLPPLPGKKSRINNIYVDHIIPIIDPKVGFTTWDEVIDRMFCEKENLQILCKECHDAKTADEKKAKKEDV